MKCIRALSSNNIRTTIVCPGAVKTELLEHISEADIQKANKDYVGVVGIALNLSHEWLLLRSVSLKTKILMKSFSALQLRNYNWVNFILKLYSSY